MFTVVERLIGSSAVIEVRQLLNLRTFLARCDNMEGTLRHEEAACLPNQRRRAVHASRKSGGSSVLGDVPPMRGKAGRALLPNVFLLVDDLAVSDERVFRRVLWIGAEQLALVDDVGEAAKGS